MSAPVIDIAAEANEACVQAVPGAVFLRLRRVDGSTVLRRMFVEMTLQEARDLVRDMQAAIRQAERGLRA
jgi:hypothetical protein